MKKVRIMEKNFLYNSFKLGEELRISGEFLDKGIMELKSYDKELQNWELFYIMYQLSVGIERLQKVLILLSYDDTGQLENIKHHDHSGLQHKINQKTNLKFENNENKMLNLLSEFYKDYRYETIEDNNKLFSVIELLVEHNFYKDNKLKRDKIIRSIIKIISIYITQIKAFEGQRQVYTTEAEVSYSIARFSILTDEEQIHNSYEKEELAKLEILYYLLNVKIDEFNNLKPIEIDEGDIKDYINELIGKKSDYSFIKDLGAGLKGVYYKDIMDLSDDEIDIRIETIKNFSEILYYELHDKNQLDD